MIKTEADLAKLTDRQREVLTAVARRLSSHVVTRLLHSDDVVTSNIDAEALLLAYATVNEVLSRLESSVPQSVCPELTALAEE